MSADNRDIRHDKKDVAHDKAKKAHDVRKRDRRRDAVDRPAFPQLANPLYYDGFAPRLAPATRQALDQANSPQEWNALLLASPEFMHR